MPKRHVAPKDLAGKVIDSHAHLGVNLKAYAALEYPYAQTVEGLYYRQIACGVDANVVFPASADLYFNLQQLVRGDAIAAAEPLSAVPYGIENEMLLREIFEFCPEHQRRLIPFVSVDPGRMVAAQVAELARLDEEFPIYGIKISPVACQTPITRLLDEGRAILDFVRARDLPLVLHTTVDPQETYSHARLAFEVIEANRDLRFCLAHCIGFHRGYLDRAAGMDNVWVDTSALKIQVELAATGSLIMAAGPDRFPADYSDHRRVMQSLAAAYPNTILWGSDSPYYSFICRRRQSEGTFERFRLKASYEDEKAALDSLPQQQRLAISNTNTLRFVFGQKRLA